MLSLLFYVAQDMFKSLPAMGACKVPACSLGIFCSDSVAGTAGNRSAAYSQPQFFCAKGLTNEKKTYTSVLTDGKGT